MRFSFFCLIAYCFCFVTCYSDGGIVTQSFSTTILVTDMDGKPLAGQKVLLFITRSNVPTAAATDSAITDNLGKVQFVYTLSTTESDSESATIKTEDNAPWKSVDTQSHNTLSNNLKSVPQQLTLRKDSLSPIRIRLQKTTATPWSVDLASYATNNPTERNKLTRSFLSFQRDGVQLFDTTFTVPVYAKASSSVEASTYRLTANGSGGYSIERSESKLLEINPADYKSAVLTIQLR